MRLPKRAWPVLGLAVVWCGLGLASSDVQQAGTLGASSTAPALRGESNLIRDEFLGFRPQAGAIIYNDATGGTSRFLLGFTADWNIAKTLWPELARDWYVGLSTGFLFSHLGDTGAGFFGAENAGFSAGANFFETPLDLRIGFAPLDWFRLSVHGGGNLVYRSMTSAMVIGDAAGLEASATVFPNVGADLEFGLSRGLLLTFRPDLTVGTQDRVFSGSLGLAFGLS